MKKIYFILFMVIWFVAARDVHGKSFAELQKLSKKNKLSKRYLAYQLYLDGKYFTSLNVLKDFYRKYERGDKEMEKLMEVLLVKAGTESLGELSSDLLKKIETPTVYLILARRFFYRQQYSTAVSFLDKIPKTHRLAPDAAILRGTIAYFQNNYYNALEAYGECSKIAYTLRQDTASKPLQRYYDLLAQGCFIDQARVYFKQKKYEKALEFYRLIPKSSYHWPAILLEKAWNYYYLKDYNRVLGLLVTYKSPLLQSYFYPEAEMLKALSYYKLCLWDDALQVISRYYAVYKNRSEQLHAMISKYKNSHSYFFNMVNTPICKNEKKNIFIRNLIVGVKKKVKYNLDRYSYENAKKEFYQIKQLPSGPLKNYALAHVKEDALYRKAKINYFTKSIFFDFLNDIYLISKRLFTLKLEILSSQRAMLYKKQNFVKRERGELSEVQRNSDEYLFRFDGEFWADELGDYSFGLKSRCKKQVVSTKQGEKHE